jgi:hypothetical protein
VAQQHNELRRAGEISRVGATDADGAVERFGETLTPVLDIWRQPEWDFLRDEFDWGFTLTQAAIAAEFGAVGVVNPTGGNKIIVVERCTFEAVTAAEGYQAGTATAAVILATLASSQSLLPRDTRWPQAASGLVAFGSDAAIGSIITSSFEKRNQAAVNISNPLTCPPVILQPGFGFVVVGTTVNQVIIVNMYGRERTTYPAERG